MRLTDGIPLKKPVKNSVQYRAVPRSSTETVQNQRPSDKVQLQSDQPAVVSVSEKLRQLLAMNNRVTALRGAAQALPPAQGVALQQAHLPTNWICKKDHYPGIHRARLQEGDSPQPLIEGAPNYREVPEHRISGMAQPSIDGLRRVLQHHKADKSETPLLWVSLREEPVVYVKGEPYTVREADFPYHNLEAEGVTVQGVELAETNLKNRFLDEISTLGGRIWLHDENVTGRVSGRWVHVSEEDIKTPREVAEQMQAEGFKVDYHRIPISDEHAPEREDLAELMELFANHDGARIVNCHAGRGRTTTGMALATMMDMAQETIAAPTPLEASSVNPQGPPADPEAQRQDLHRALHRLTPHRRLADLAIEKVSAVQNLRTSIFNKHQAPSAPGVFTNADETARMMRYTKRYFKLIEAAQYLHERQRLSEDPGYTHWAATHSEATRAIDLASDTLTDWHLRNHGSNY